MTEAGTFDQLRARGSGVAQQNKRKSGPEHNASIAEYSFLAPRKPYLLARKAMRLDKFCDNQTVKRIMATKRRRKQRKPSVTATRPHQTLAPNIPRAREAKASEFESTNHELPANSKLISRFVLGAL
jgi:hypothetical protein